MVLKQPLGWGQIVRIVYRPEWGARKADLEGLGYSILPFDHVLYKQAGSDLCAYRADCIRAIRNIQDDHIEGGAPDIHYKYCGSS